MTTKTGVKKTRMVVLIAPTTNDDLNYFANLDDVHKSELVRHAVAVYLDSRRRATVGDRTIMALITEVNRLKKRMERLGS